MGAEAHKDFFDQLETSLVKNTFVKLTLSKPIKHDDDLRNVYLRLIEIKKVPTLSFTFRHKTNDIVKNHEGPEALSELKRLMEESFRIATLMTTENDFSLKISKKGEMGLYKSKPTHTKTEDLSHDKKKEKRASTGDMYLQSLGITDSSGAVIPKMADKYRQINKYLEIVESLVEHADLPDEVNVVDMGSGKGYLTFALYDFLHNKKKMNVNVVGIELRQELVDYCNGIARDCGFDQLNFVSQRIEEYTSEKIDILIALHACDTATDDAIKKGIVSDSALIICAPCCHKQIRQQVKGQEQSNPLLKYGIFKERQFEMVTDTMRALLMEKAHYQTKIFEFVSNEHTRKNIMLVGTKSSVENNEDEIDQKLDNLKKDYGIEFHYLEKAIESNS